MAAYIFKNLKCLNRCDKIRVNLSCYRDASIVILIVLCFFQSWKIFAVHLIPPFSFQWSFRNRVGKMKSHPTRRAARMSRSDNFHYAGVCIPRKLSLLGFALFGRYMCLTHILCQDNHTGFYASITCMAILTTHASHVPASKEREKSP